MIHAEGLSKTFYVHRKEAGLWGSVKSLIWRRKEPRHAVKGVSFDVGPGEIVGLVGANGAGKTTLVKMLAGIIVPTDGKASVLGFDPWQRDNRMRRQIALIMGQKAQLWWDLPAADCFLLLREVYQIPRARFDKELAALASILDVEEHLHVQIRRLSLGERMKMELIAALLHSPRVVFLDEPTIGLDLTAQRAIREFILRYRQDHQPAMLLTSHYMEDIERLCKRILIIRRGELVFDGPLAEVAERYASHKVVAIQLSEEVDRKQLAGDLQDLQAAFEEPAPNNNGSDPGEEEDELKIRVRAPRERVADVAGRLLQLLPVADLSIEEEEIGGIITRIMQEREDDAVEDPAESKTEEGTREDHQ